MSVSCPFDGASPELSWLVSFAGRVRLSSTPSQSLIVAMAASLIPRCFAASLTPASREGVPCQFEVFQRRGEIQEVILTVKCLRSMIHLVIFFMRQAPKLLEGRHHVLCTWVLVQDTEDVLVIRLQAFHHSLHGINLLLGRTIVPFRGTTSPFSRRGRATSTCPLSLVRAGLICSLTPLLVFLQTGSVRFWGLFWRCQAMGLSRRIILLTSNRFGGSVAHCRHFRLQTWPRAEMCNVKNISERKRIQTGYPCTIQRTPLGRRY